ncbi:SPOR domain-containing protein [Amphritea sp. 1_MG-2023]|uniref:SPOR domain-containing protein n=1 Tax=Amphritea sp. 1_MG-2023 TaxID=3062670 RepID=UPI0026E2983B|nr:SPOR domain-containing protein [Amphritea sp. 1_MG-2023]MDO6564272.1 SPOR domain-containing protein [Amphritea sp. 1_MG-2023]
MARIVFSLVTIVLFFSAALRAEDQTCRRFYDDGQSREALHHCLPLAAQGDGEASFILSNLYSQGFEGGSADLQQALSWLTRSAEQGYAPGCYNLAVLYETGGVVDQDMSVAFRWYLEGATLGHLASQLKTGLAYLKGKGTDKDLTEARYWLTQAADRGDQSAQVMLATLFKDSDPEKSIQLYQQAAQQGNRFAYYQLAGLLREGSATRDVNLAQALTYAIESERLGYEPAIELVESIKQQQVLEVAHRITLGDEAIAADVDGLASLERVTTHAAEAPKEKAVKQEALNNTVALDMAEKAAIQDTEVNKSNAASASLDAVGLHDFAWLMAQPEHNYVLQLAQLSSAASVKAYLATYQLEGKTHYFKAITPGGEKYVVLFAQSGRTLPEAKQLAAKHLPEGLKGMVWYRTYRAILGAYTSTDSVHVDNDKDDS